ncbi:unnamed protein product [Arctogadus glacialis]
MRRAVNLRCHEPRILRRPTALQQVPRSAWTKTLVVLLRPTTGYRPALGHLGPSPPSSSQCAWIPLRCPGRSVPGVVGLFPVLSVCPQCGRSVPGAFGLFPVPPGRASLQTLKLCVRSQLLRLLLSSFLYAQGLQLPAGGQWPPVIGSSQFDRGTEIVAREEPKHIHLIVLAETTDHLFVALLKLIMTTRWREGGRRDDVTDEIHLTGIDLSIGGRGG